MASEFALVGIRKTRVKELVNRGNSSAKLIQKALNNLDSYISATQLGITLASLALGWIGEPAVAHYLEPYLVLFLPYWFVLITAHSLAVLVAFSLITFLHIVLGELAPKTIALQRAESISLLTIIPLTAFLTIFKPFIWVLRKSGSLLIKSIGLKSPQGSQLIHSEEEIRMILDQSRESGLIPSNEAEMVNNIFKLGDTSVKQIMVPRTDIIAFNVAMTLREVEKRIKKNPHSRFPVYEQSIDTIIGFIHVKDIYLEILVSDKDKKLSETSFVRQILTVPENKKADAVLVQMKRKRVHIAIVNDEYGGTAGLVTLEDVIESVIGEIEDEFEKPQKEIQRQTNGTYLVDGLTPIEKIQEKFKLPLKGQGYTTIGGLVFGLLGHEPRVGNQVQIGNLVLGIETIEGKRIKTLSLKKSSSSKLKS